MPVAEPLVLPAPPRRLARILGRVDGALNALHGSRYNPLYQSGTVAVALLALLVVTGLYLLLFYRVGAPWSSVARIHDQVLLGRWIRGVHRFAADGALLAAAVHALRMFAQRRSWGRRTLPWISGVALVGVILVCGWTGYVMVWDSFGQMLAIEGARILDLVPIFTDPVGRAFTGEHPLPSAFFFLNLFLHIALPIGLGILLLLHVSRMARPALLPPRRAMWAGFALLTLAAVLWPVPMAPAADALLRPSVVPLDVFYGGWLAATRAMAPWQMGLGWLALTVLALAVPRLTRPAITQQPGPSVVNERLCTGCTQCALDCPWEAIAMVPREHEAAEAAGHGRSELVARVDPAVCVSCGICAGSCAPMGVGPAGRTGRDQLAQVREFVAATQPRGDDVVVIGCSRAAGGFPSVSGRRIDGAPVMHVDCAGSVHSSVVEYLVRSGAGGVLVLACPANDCWNREGTRWLEQRLFHEREAELQARVDRRRVAVANLSSGEEAAARRAVAALRDQVRALSAASAEEDVDLLRLCRNAEEEPGSTERAEVPA